MTGRKTHIADGPADDTLMQRYRQGDAEAFDQLYDRYRLPVYRFFRRQLPGPDADECHQEVWLKLINGHQQYQPRGEFRAYLFTIAHHTLTDRHRRQMKHTHADADTDIDGIADPDTDPAAQADGDADVARLQRLIAALPFAQREALIMKEMAGLSIADIARITQTSEEGVKSRVRYAMQRLRQAWSPTRTAG